MVTQGLRRMLVCGCAAPFCTFECRCCARKHRAIVVDDIVPEVLRGKSLRAWRLSGPGWVLA